MTERHSGGYIHGPNGEDSIPVWLCPGYYWDPFSRSVRETVGEPLWKQALKDFNDSQVAHQETPTTTVGQG